MALSPEKREVVSSVLGSALAIGFVTLVGTALYVSSPQKVNVDKTMEAERLRIRAILSATTNSVPAEPVKQLFDTQK